MKRRHILGLMAGATGPVVGVARAQQGKKVPILGFLHPGQQALGSFTLDALKRDLGSAGFVDGQTVRVEERWGAGKPEQLGPLARELVESGADVIIAVARPSIDAARAASTTVPIVANDLETDPLATGYIASLGKPGSNVTGLFLDAPALCGKWLQQITELVPNLGTVAVLWDTTTGPYQRDAFLAAAKTAGLAATLIAYRGGATVESVLDAALARDTQALVQLGSPLFNQSGGLIAAVLASRRVPGISPFRTFAANGGLVSYGVDLVELYRRLVPFVAKVLRGARPGDLPIEQPSKFELVVNLKAAKALGLTVPPKFLLTADEVIE